MAANAYPTATPREGNAASRWVKSTYKKLTTAAPPVPALSAGLASTSRLPSSTSSSSLAKSSAPLTSSTSNRFGLSQSTFGVGPSRAFAPSSSKQASPVVKKAEPGWKKFDLQASLAKPLSYTPKLGEFGHPLFQFASR